MPEMSKKKSTLFQLSFWVILLSFAPVHAAPARRIIQYSYTIQNNSNQVLSEAEFWAFGPVKKTSTQQCAALDASHEFELLVDDLGNQVMHFTFKNLPPFGAVIVRIRAEIVVNETPMEISGDEQLFLGQEKYVEADALAIKKLATELKGGTPLITAGEIYSWVADNIEYSGFAGSERGALSVLESRQGDCTEYMDLFTALARAAGIPTRRLGGYVAAADTVLKPADYHNWSEFYDNGVWKLADAQKKNFAVNQADYIVMQIISDNIESPMAGFNRFRFEGEGLQAWMNI